MFQGASQLTLDGKGRVSMPSKHRDALAVGCDGRLTLTRHPDGCLLVYPRPTWEARREQIAHAACGVVARHGFENATVVRIARAATGRLRFISHSKTIE